MKIDLNRCTKFLYVAATVAMVASAAQAEGCIKTARWADDAPYTYRDISGQLKGLDVELIQEALTGLKCDVQWVEMPWARALIELEHGRLDILGSSRMTDERQRYARFSIAVNRSPNVLFMTHAAALKYPINTLKDILKTNLKLGVQIGVLYSSDYEALLENPDFNRHLTQISSRRGGWKMMDFGRIDAMIADEVTGLVELRQLGLLSKIEVNRAISTGVPAYVAFSKASVDKAFVDAFNREVTAMVSDGRYRKMREKYIPCPVSADGIGCK
jgi:polar amino acid transport system substrate-binding protein